METTDDHGQVEVASIHERASEAFLVMLAGMVQGDYPGLLVMLESLEESGMPQSVAWALVDRACPGITVERFLAALDAARTRCTN